LGVTQGKEFEGIYSDAIAIRKKDKIISVILIANDWWRE
jgi:hypothetical protein